MIFIVIFMVSEIRDIIKLRLSYFAKYWVYVEWLIIGFAWASFVLYLQRLYSVNKISDKLKNYDPSSPELIRLQLSSYFNDSLGYCLAFSAALATLKFLKLFRFSGRVMVFVQAFKEIFYEVAGFMLIFAIVWIAFIQLMYLTFNTQTNMFSSIVRSSTTGFEIMLGKFDGSTVDILVQAYNVLGPLYSRHMW